MLSVKSGSGHSHTFRHSESSTLPGLIYYHSPGSCSDNLSTFCVLKKLIKWPHETKWKYFTCPQSFGFVSPHCDSSRLLYHSSANRFLKDKHILSSDRILQLPWAMQPVLRKNSVCSVLTETSEGRETSQGLSVFHANLVTRLLNCCYPGSVICCGMYPKGGVYVQGSLVHAHILISEVCIVRSLAVYFFIL